MREIDPRDCQHGYADSQQEEIDRLRIRIKELEAVRSWYTATYAIPDELGGGHSDDVLCLLNDGTFVVAWYDHDDDLWIDSYSERCIQMASGRHVTHWRKLLEGPILFG